MWLKMVVAIGVVVFGWYTLDYLAVFERSSAPQAAESEKLFRIEEVARGLEVPWSIAWTSPTRMLVTERSGRIRAIENGALLEKPVYVVPDVSTGGESGLMGLAISPEYASDRFVYASYTYARDSSIFVKIVRLIDTGTELVFDRLIFDRIPAASHHAGSRIAFGPDGMLYVTTGDALERSLAQDLTSLAGKTLRIRPDGTVPDDNPFSDSPVWSYGHRNSQGIAWHPSGTLYQSEHGPSVLDGPAGGDEINRIIAGGNYGWPIVSHEETREGMIAPLALFTPAEAPAAVIAYTGELFPAYNGNLFVSALRGAGILRVQLSEDGARVIAVQKLVSGYGRIRALSQGPDGALYFSTSNHDGRGEPRDGDDRIMRIVPTRGVLR